ncbi:MAG TPA: glycosyltransferase family 4 protein [Sphingomonas sp.]|jgi:glycosyltransferase involved in cell wall biosynthesis
MTRVAIEQQQQVDPEPRRIVFVLSGLTAGGAERVVSLISNAWQQSGSKITIITFDSDEQASFHPLSPDITVRRLNIPAARGGRVAAMRTMVARIRALRNASRASEPDVIISFLTKINVLTLLASLFTPWRVVISERNNPQRQEKSRIWNSLLAALSWRAVAIVMQTEASLKCLGSWRRRRAIVINNPIELGQLERRDHDGLVLAAAGRLTPQKGFDMLIDAFARIAPRHPGWRLIIWGEGELRAALLRQVAATGLGSRILMPGNSANPEQWVAGADAFVVSSRYEGFCNALGEAMAGGVAVASFACDFGPPDMIRHDVNGLLVPVENVAALAAALDRLMSEPALRDRLGCAAQDSMWRYNPDVIIGHWDRLVDSLIEPLPPRPNWVPSKPVVEHRGTDPGWSSDYR